MEGFSIIFIVPGVAAASATTAEQGVVTPRHSSYILYLLRVEKDLPSEELNG
jgi:hypothetical protein